MSTTSHILDTDEIRSLVPGDMVELGDFGLGMFLGKEENGGRIACYSFLFKDGRKQSFKGTLGLMHMGLKKVNNEQ